MCNFLLRTATCRVSVKYLTCIYMSLHVDWANVNTRVCVCVCVWVFIYTHSITHLKGLCLLLSGHIGMTSRVGISSCFCFLVGNYKLRRQSIRSPQYTDIILCCGCVTGRVQCWVWWDRVKPPPHWRRRRERALWHTTQDSTTASINWFERLELTMSRSYNDELQFLDKIDKTCWRIKKGFVPNMKVIQCLSLKKKKKKRVVVILNQSQIAFCSMSNWESVTQLVKLN